MQPNHAPILSFTRRTGRLETRHIWAAWTVANLVAIGMATGFAFNSHRQVEQHVSNLGDNLLQAIEQPILAKIEHVRAGQDLMALALHSQATPAGVDRDAAEAVVSLLQGLRKDPLSPRVSDAAGNLIIGETARLPSNKVNYAHRDYFKALAADPSLPYFIGTPVFSMVLKTPAVVSASPYTGKDKQFAGIVLETLVLSSFDKILAAPALQDDDSIVLRDARDLSLLSVRKHVDSDQKRPAVPAAAIDGANWPRNAAAPRL